MKFTHSRARVSLKLGIREPLGILRALDILASTTTGTATGTELSNYVAVVPLIPKIRYITNEEWPKSLYV